MLTAITISQNAMCERILVLMATHGRFLETYTVWQKLAVLDFVALGILSTTWWFLYPRPISKPKNISSNQNGVKCNADHIITPETTLTVPLPMLYWEHNKGVEHNAICHTKARPCYTIHTNQPHTHITVPSSATSCPSSTVWPSHRPTKLCSS